MVVMRAERRIGETVIYFSMASRGEKPSPRIQMISREKCSLAVASFFEKSSLLQLSTSFPHDFDSIRFDS